MVVRIPFVNGRLRLGFICTSKFGNVPIMWQFVVHSFCLQSATINFAAVACNVLVAEVFFKMDYRLRFKKSGKRYNRNYE